MKIDTTCTCTLTHRYNMLCIFVRSSQWRAPRYIYRCKPSNHPKNRHGNNRYSVFSALHSFHCLALSHFRGMSNIYKHKFFINCVCVETLSHGHVVQSLSELYLCFEVARSQSLQKLAHYRIGKDFSMLAGLFICSGLVTERNIHAWDTNWIE